MEQFGIEVGGTCATTRLETMEYVMEVNGGDEAAIDDIILCANMWILDAKYA